MSTMSIAPLPSARTHSGTPLKSLAEYGVPENVTFAELSVLVSLGKYTEASIHCPLFE